MVSMKGAATVPGVERAGLQRQAALRHGGQQEVARPRKLLEVAEPGVGEPIEQVLDVVLEQPEREAHGCDRRVIRSERVTRGFPLVG